MIEPAVLVARVAIVGLGLAAWFWTQRLIAGRGPAGGGVGDKIHEWTAGLHARLLARPAAANATLIASSALIDVFGVYLIGSAVFGASFRPFLSLLFLYVLRQACQGMVALPCPPGTLWRHPGFPSLLVTYGTGNDYFFSGHTAIAVLGAIEIALAGPPWLGALACAVALFEAAAVLVLRAHYTMDVFTAAVTAWCAHAVGRAAAPAFDAWIARLAGG
jgi:hypothetical protein